MKTRNDDFQSRRKHIKDMSDAELKEYFFELTKKVTNPLYNQSLNYTSKSIERSVLLRMGFSSLESKKIVDILDEHDLLPHGAGHCVFHVASINKIDLKGAGKLVIEGKYIADIKEGLKE